MNRQRPQENCLRPHQICKVRTHLPHGSPIQFNNFPRLRIPRAPKLRKLLPTRRLRPPPRKLPARQFPQRSPRTKRLHAPNLSKRLRPIIAQPSMPNLRRQPVYPVIDFAIKHYPHSKPRPTGKVQQPRATAPRPPKIFRQAASRRIMLHPRRQFQPLFKNLLKRNIVPPRQVRRRKNHPRFRVQWPPNRYADSPYPRVPPQKRLRMSHDLFNHLPRPTIGPRRKTRSRHSVSGRVPHQRS